MSTFACDLFGKTKLKTKKLKTKTKDCAVRFFFSAASGGRMNEPFNITKLN